MTLEVRPADEPVRALDVLDEVANGNSECGYTAGSFFSERDPVLALLTFVPFGLDFRQQAAWLRFDGESHAELAWSGVGVVAIPCGNTGAQMGGWFRKPITRPEDFSGLRIRTAGLPALALKELGALPQSLAAHEIVPALAAGTLDAADWIGPYDDLRMGFHRHAPYYHHPGVMEPSAELSLIVNPAAYAALPEDLRAVLELAAAEAGRDLMARYDARNPPALSTLEAEGARLVAFPAAVIDALRGATTTVLERLASQSDPFACALESYWSFMTAGERWARLERSASETPFALSASVLEATRQAPARTG
jgi:TRAP-type mannitol/chloroaromatic compound transport system substrate-binding protein